MARDIPIIFSAPMVRALLDGRKTQTRRLATSPLAKAQPGDRLWVRETIEIQGAYTDGVRVVYEASRPRGGSEAIGMVAVRPGTAVPVHPGKLRPSIHMPRWASRITLVVEEVRVQRLQDISEADAIAEGAPRYTSQTKVHRAWNPDWKGLYRPGFMELWDSLHGGEAWDANPFVVALAFRVERANIDALTPEPALAEPQP